MTTRETKRRELQDLAKLAVSMPRERPTPKPEPPSLQRPPTPSVTSMSLPPAVASIPVPSVMTAARTESKSGNGRFIAIAGIVGLAIAVGGGITAGRYFAGRGQALAPNAAAALGAVVQPAETNPPAAQAPPAAAASPVTADVPLATPPADTVAPVVATASPKSSPATVTRALPRHAAPASTTGRSSLTAVIPASKGGSKDSLEDAIRKAVASPSHP